MNEPAYLNGSFLPLDEACVPVLDRGFLFGDSVYEVIPVYAGRPFRLAEHLNRLGRSLNALDIAEPMSRTDWEIVFRELARRCGSDEALIYAQVTRGVAQVRDHAAVGGLTATVFATAKPFAGMTAEERARGLDAITLEDIRWRRCDIKATTLLANVLARKQASEQGAAEAILIRDGNVTEGAASNVFAVLNGLIVTPPKTSDILAGITRDVILELAGGAGLPYAEARIGEDDLRRADEIWISSSSKEVVPIVRLNGEAVGDGRPGPLWHRMHALFAALKQRLAEAGRATA